MDGCGGPAPELPVVTMYNDVELDGVERAGWRSDLLPTSDTQQLIVPLVFRSSPPTGSIRPTASTSGRRRRSSPPAPGGSTHRSARCGTPAASKCPAIRVLVVSWLGSL